MTNRYLALWHYGWPAIFINFNLRSSAWSAGILAVHKYERFVYYSRRSFSRIAMAISVTIGRTAFTFIWVAVHHKRFFDIATPYRAVDSAC
jgi:hypothetical protein